MVLDFANEADEIEAAFEPYYETTLLSEATDPNLLYEIQTRLAAFPVYGEAHVDAFAKIYFDSKATQDQLYAVLAPVVEHFLALSGEERHDFRGQLTDYVRLYAFLAQVLTFADADLEKLYVFAWHLRRLLPSDGSELPREVQQNIDMESYRIQQTASGKIPLERRPGVLEPVSTKQGHGAAPEELETLSRIIAELNERFGLNLGPEHRVTLGQMMEKLDDDAALDAAARVNTRENVRLTFDQKVEHVIQEIVDSNFDLYKRITDDRAFGEAIKNFLFDQYLRAHRNAEELIKRGESRTLEFKSTLRWDLKENRQDDKLVTHAVLETIAAFLNTEGGDLLIGVADDGGIVGIERDQLESDDKFMRHLAQVVRGGMPNDAVDCVVTSPPYYWQRDYGVKGQAGQEETVDEYVRNLVQVFRQVKRTLKKTGVVFLVLGDTYYSGRGRPTGGDPKQAWRSVARQKYRAVDRPGMGLPRKSLIGIPWRVALALQRDGLFGIK
jgi:type I restriction enzyme R subunit